MSFFRLSRLTRSSLILLVVALTMVTAACTAPTAAPASQQPAAQTAAPAQAAAPSGQQVTVTYWAHDHAPRVELDKKYIAEFEKANPNIKIDYVVVPGSDYDTKLATALAAGTGPDLFAQYDAFTGQFYAQDAIVPVDFLAMGFNSQKELMDQYESPDVILSGALFKGVLYGIPNEVSIYGCFVNNALWKAAGLDPTKDFPATYEDLIPIAEKLTKRDDAGKLVQRGFDVMWSDPTYFLDWEIVTARQFGVEVIDRDTLTAHFDTPEAAKGLQYIVDWANKYKLGGPGYQDSREAFNSGTMAMECTLGSWAVAGAKENKIDYSIHMQPLWAGAKVKNYASPYAYFHSVTKKAAPEVAKAAWKLAYYLDSRPELYLTNAGLLQPRKDLIASKTFQDTPDLSLFLDEMKTSKYDPSVGGYNEIADIVARARDRCVQQGMDVKASLAQAQTEVQAVLDKQKK
jgi:multiple sugar transport system substrate-binding protein